MQHLVSIIIPAFNVEKYIGRCLESILLQTYKNLEIIVIDDGSSDKTSSVIKKYAENDSRIIFLKKQNSGVSASRNAGLDIAKGKYVCFFDSDDFMNSDHIQSLVYSITSSDDIDCSINSYNLYSQKLNRISKTVTGTDGCFYGISLSERLILHNGDEHLISGVNNKLYSSDIINKYNLRLNESISYGEDWLFNIIYYSKSRLVIINNYPSSNYVQYEEERLSTKFNYNGLKTALQIREILFNIFPDILQPSTYAKQIIGLKDIYTKKYTRMKGIKGFFAYIDIIINNYTPGLKYFIKLNINNHRLNYRDIALLDNHRNRFAFLMAMHCLPDILKYYSSKILSMFHVYSCYFIQQAEKTDSKSNNIEYP